MTVPTTSAFADRTSLFYQAFDGGNLLVQSLLFYWILQQCSLIPSLWTYAYIVFPLQVVFAAGAWFCLGPWTKAKSAKEHKRVSQLLSGGNTFTPGMLSKRMSAFSKVDAVDIDPFVNESHLCDSRERVRVTIAACTYVPIRVAFVVLFICICAAFGHITMLGLDRTNLPPIVGWRKVPQRIMMLFFRIVLYCAGFLWIDTQGSIVGKDKAGLVLCNHMGFIEPIYLMSQSTATPVAAKENTMIPVIGTVFQALQTVAVEREKRESKHAAIEQLKMRAVDPRFPPVLIFPEGTCTNNSALISFKVGAFIPGVPVQPCVVKFTCSNTAPFWTNGTPSLPMIIFRMIAEPVNVLSAKYLDVYTPNEAEKEDPKLFGNNVRLIMAKALGVPATNHSFMDVLLQAEALKNKGDSNAMHKVEFETIKEKFDVSFDTAKKSVKQFTKMASASGNRGTISLTDFVDFYGNEQTDFVKHLFSLLDKDGDGEIDFYEFAVGLGVTDPSNPAQLSKLAFRMFDLNDDGFVEIEDLDRLLLHTIPELKTEADRQALLRQYDTTKTGRLDMEAFTQFAKSNPTYASIFTQLLKLTQDANEVSSTPGKKTV